MGIDSSIYAQQTPLDIMGSVQTGMKMSDMMQQNRLNQRKLAEDQAMRDAYQGAIGKDGTVDSKMVMSNLAKNPGANPMQIAETQQKLAQQQRDTQKANLESAMQKVTIGGQLLGSANDQASWTKALRQAEALNISKPGEHPEQFDPVYKTQLQNQTLNTQQQLEQHWKKEGHDLDARKTKVSEGELAVKQQEQRRKGGAAPKGFKYAVDPTTGEAVLVPENPAKHEFDHLAPEKQKTVEELAKKNAGKTSIMNQINSAMSGWDSLPDDQKVSAGRQLLKTLNSTEGADAIGAEEAKRLGGKLEFALGNITNSNPTQFGRDLEGFKTQTGNVAKAIKGAIEANQKVIDESYGRQAKPAGATGGWNPANPPTLKTNQIKWKK